MLTIDGIIWPLTAKVVRTSRIEEDPETSGLMMDKSKSHNVIGTYLEYEISIAVPFWAVGSYSNFYEAITDPVDGHTAIVPYNEGEISITGFISIVRDEYVRNKADNGNYWRETTFTISSNAPFKTYTLGEKIVRGRAPLPELSAGVMGDTWTYTSSGWVHGHYDDADTMYF